MPVFTARIIPRAPRYPKDPHAASAAPVSRSRFRSRGVFLAMIEAATKADARSKLRLLFPAPHFGIGTIAAQESGVGSQESDT